ncbi:hypothetical protein Acr_12g0003220 [Actinidia rufa]|uniref:Uncharacterized protein n=1 Tax=Actinidia rufa TaxID=165716 RepID=A0A7J0FGG8_9ERIC|nr:hypothetical protein Acr_12g0003220 [Actinidia rufa]
MTHSNSPQKPHQFRTPKGTKKIESPNSKIEIHWDLSAAKFDSGPEPVTGFFLLVVVDSELTLRLGDAHNGVVPDVEIANVPGVKIAKSALLSRREQFCGSGLYSCRAKFCDTGLGVGMTADCGWRRRIWSRKDERIGFSLLICACKSPPD